MERTSPTYFTAYQSLKLTRDAEGVLVVEFHTNGGPLTFTAQDHTDFVAWNTIRWPIFGAALNAVRMGIPQQIAAQSEKPKTSGFDITD